MATLRRLQRTQHHSGLQGARVGVKRCLLLAAACVCVAPLGAGSAARADDDAAVRARRWKDLQQAIFPGRRLQAGQGGIPLHAPARAVEAAPGPVSPALTGGKASKGGGLVVEAEPAPPA